MYIFQSCKQLEGAARRGGTTPLPKTSDINPGNFLIRDFVMSRNFAQKQQQRTIFSKTNPENIFLENVLIFFRIFKIKRAFF